MLLAELIVEGKSVISSGDEKVFKKWQSNIRKFLSCHPEVSDQDKKTINTSIACLLNPFSSIENKSKVIATATEAVEVLELLETSLNNTTTASNNLPISSALVVINRILENFYAHIAAMYQSDTHGRAGITKELLYPIQIKNEYDVQRILYALLKPIFPMARLEKHADAGYLANRYDIVIDEYEICIEVKCTRDSMTESTLVTEIGSDIAHYTSKHLFFFVYDKKNMLKNKQLFEFNYTKKESDRDIRTFVVQPVTL